MMARLAPLVAMTVEAEKRSEKLSWFFVVAMLGATVVCAALRFTARPESHGNWTLMAVVAGLWALGAWISARRHQHRLVLLDELAAVVTAKLGH